MTCHNFKLILAIVIILFNWNSSQQTHPIEEKIRESKVYKEKNSYRIRIKVR